MSLTGGKRAVGSRLLVGLVADDTDRTPSLLNVAISFCHSTSSSMSVFVFPASLLQPFPLTAGTSSIWYQQELDKLAREAAATLKLVRGLLSTAGINAVCTSANTPFGLQESHFFQAACAHDIIMLEAPSSTESSRRVENFLFRSGRPVLMVPETTAQLPSRVSIGWDGSAQAVRAIAGALPILRGADDVFVVTVTGEKDVSSRTPNAMMVEYLQWHGIRSKALELHADRGDVLVRLELFCQEEEIGFMVTGAYAHSRVKEAIFGGVTRSILDRCTMPVLMAN
jgi:nucleotide-binding universal stress UspA family protein